MHPPWTWSHEWATTEGTRPRGGLSGSRSLSADGVSLIWSNSTVNYFRKSFDTKILPMVFVVRLFSLTIESIEMNGSYVTDEVKGFQ
jgi:hypothetical protein